MQHDNITVNFKKINNDKIKPIKIEINKLFIFKSTIFKNCIQLHDSSELTIYDYDIYQFIDFVFFAKENFYEHPESLNFWQLQNFYKMEDTLDMLYKNLDFANYCEYIEYGNALRTIIGQIIGSSTKQFYENVIKKSNFKILNIEKNLLDIISESNDVVYNDLINKIKLIFKNDYPEECFKYTYVLYNLQFNIENFDFITYERNIDDVKNIILNFDELDVDLKNKIIKYYIIDYNKLKKLMIELHKDYLDLEN